MAGTNDVRYALYANSFGSERTYFPGTKAGEPHKPYDRIRKVIAGIRKDGEISYISEEFRAKALSVLLQRSKFDPTDHQYLEILKSLPVARTKSEVDKLVEERDRFVSGNPNIAEGKGSFANQESINDVKIHARENKFESNPEFVEKALALITSGKIETSSRYATRAGVIDEAIRKKNTDSKAFSDVMTALDTAYTAEGFELPKPLKKKAAEPAVPVASTATDTPSVPDATVVAAPDQELEDLLVSMKTEFNLNDLLVNEFRAKGIETARAYQAGAREKKEKNALLKRFEDELGASKDDIDALVQHSVKDLKKTLKKELKKRDTLLEEIEAEFPDVNALGDLNNRSSQDLERLRDEERAKAADNNQTFVEEEEEVPAAPAAPEPAAPEPEPSAPEPEPAAPEQPPEIEQEPPADEAKRELLAEIFTTYPDLNAETRALLENAKLERIRAWKKYTEDHAAAEVTAQAALDEEDDNADDGFFGLRNNFTQALMLLDYADEDFQQLSVLLEGQPKPVYEAALVEVLANPGQIMDFTPEFLNGVLQGQQEAGNLIGEGAEPAVEPTVDAGTASTVDGGEGAVDPEQAVEPKPSVSGSQPITGTGSDSEKLQYRPRVHPDVLEIFFGQSSYPEWDPDLEKKLMSMEMPEARRIEIMDEVIAEYGTKIFIKARKGSSKEELNELVQLQFCVMRNLQRGPRAKTASIKVADLVRMQSLAAGSGTPAVPGSAVPGSAVPGSAVPGSAALGPEAQQVANIQAAPKPMITSPGDTITNAQVQSFSESKFISDYSKMQMSKNLNSGVKLEYPNPVPRIYNNETPQTVNHPGHAAGLGRRKVSVFSSGKF